MSEENNEIISEETDNIKIKNIDLHEDLNEDLNTQFDEICQEIALIKTSIGSVMSKLRQYKKTVEKTLKDVLKDVSKDTNQKEKKSRGVKVEIKKPSIIMPVVLSNDLCDFLNKPKDTEMTRTQITKDIYAYIKKNKLQDQNTKQKINYDENLKKLLRLNENEELTYLNLQHYLNPHFPN
jgi:chromatin remodeling complex protein RSC6